MNIKKGIKLLSETEGVGTPLKKGDFARIRLNGWLNKGEPIFQRDSELQIKLGGRQVIAGIEYSLVGMKQGGRRKVRISPHLGYRDDGLQGTVPANAVLIYEIEVLEVRPAALSQRSIKLTPAPRRAPRLPNPLNTKNRWRSAVKKGDIDKVRKLLDEGTDINVLDKHGQTALMNAVIRNNLELAKFLIKRGADLNHTAKWHLTALFLAVMRKQPEFVKVLVEAGADAQIKGLTVDGNCTPLEYAQRYGYADSIRILQKAT